MRWFRFYTEALHDPKVQLLPDKLFKDWINVLCASAATNGVVPDEKALAFTLRVTTHSARNTLVKLRDAGLLDQDERGTLRVHNWDGRQFNTEEKAQQRVARYRQKLASNGVGPNDAAKFREQVYRRDGEKCIYCLSDEQLCLDHIVPVSQGGKTHPDNLATACKRCNSGKSGRTPEQAGYDVKAEHAHAIVATAISNHERVIHAQHDTVSQHVTKSSGDMVVTRPRARDTDTETEYTPYIPQKNGTQKPDQLCAEVFHRIVKRHAAGYRHPMKMQMIVSEWTDAIGKRPDDPCAQADIIDKAHEAACSTDQWQGKYREALDKWLRRTGYMDDYPEPEEDHIESAKDYLAREAARYAAQQQGD